MKRTEIFALAGACALAMSAVVGGAGLSSSLDVADVKGTVTERPGVSTVGSTSGLVSETTAPTPAADPVVGDPAVEEPVLDEPVVDEVVPPPPVVLPTEKDSNKDHSGENCDDRHHDHSHAGDGNDRWGGRGGDGDRGGDRSGSRDGHSGKGGGHGGGGRHSGGR